MPVHPPGLSAAERREERRALEARMHTALVYGVGQLLLAALGGALTWEVWRVVPAGEASSTSLIGLLLAFTLYCVYRGGRQVHQGLALRRAFRASAPRRPGP